ncbi:cytosolic phospholipase A2 gamma [Thomomys bottae]
MDQDDSGGAILNSSQDGLTLEGREKEKACVETRSHRVLAALKCNGIQATQAPAVALLGSGGGMRAHIAFLGVLSELEELGLLDAIMYLAGVSGSTWAMSSFYSSHGDIAQVEMDLKQRFEQQEWNLSDSLQKAIESSRFTNYSLTDFWAYLVVSRQSREFQDSCLSSLQEDVEAGKLPYPIFAAIDNDLQDEWVKEKTKYSWFEFTPHHAGYPALGAYIPITQFGSKFQNGKLSTPECERDLSFLRGLWGSAVANSKENKKYISVIADSRGINVAAADHFEFTGADEIFKLKEVYGPVCRELEETIPKWKAMPEEEQSEFLWFLGDSLTLQTQPEETLQMQPEETLQKQSMVTLQKQPVVTLQTQPEETVEYSLKAVGSSMWGTFLSTSSFLTKTMMCILKWEWGTIYNFLHASGSKNDKTVEKMCRRNVIHLVDAGLAINSAYPLVLPPARDVQLILSFDFSAGDPFETVLATADYCERHGIPFPPVDKAKLEKCATTPDSCYIFKGDTGPTVMHFPLFNLCNCKDDIETWRKNYGTFKISDTYSLELVKDLLDKAKENVRINKQIILDTIKEMVGSCSESS